MKRTDLRFQSDVEDCEALLSGAVHSSLERQHAVRAARLTGVKKVVDCHTTEPLVTEGLRRRLARKLQQ